MRSNTSVSSESKAVRSGEATSNLVSSNSQNHTTVDIGQKIADFRKALGMTQKNLADELGVTVTTIANWERGRRNLDWLVDAKKLCDALKCDLDELIEEEEGDPSYDELIQLYRSGQLGKS